MHSYRRKLWLPLTAAVAGLMVSPLFAQDTSEESAKADKQEKTKHNVEVIADGQIVISDGKGNVKMMKLKKDGENAFVWKQESGKQADGERKIIVRQESDKQTEGKQAGKVRAVLVGPDGKQEVELHLDGAEGEWIVGDGEAGQWLHLLPGAMNLEHDVLLNLNSHVSGFMIGVSCGELGNTLKKQLGIESGLVVESVVPDSPAAGNLEEHDILIRAGDENLTEIGQLVEAVQAAGEAEKDVNLAVLRSGKEIRVSLTPKKREIPEGMDIETLGENGFLLKMSPEMEHAYSFDFSTVGPGVIEWQSDDSGSSDDLKAEIESLRKKLEELSGKLDGKK